MNNEFSLALGLVDFLNPILMSAFFFITRSTVRNVIRKNLWTSYIIGYILVLLAGFMIPAYKCIVGLTDMEFELPVGLVTIANTGYLIAGFSLFFGTRKKRAQRMNSVLSPVSLLNSLVVIGGAIGLILIYVSFIRIAYQRKLKQAAACFWFSLVLTFCLALLGATMDETQAVFHWIEEIVNIIGMSVLCAGGFLISKTEGQN